MYNIYFIFLLSVKFCKKIETKLRFFSNKISNTEFKGFNAKGIDCKTTLCRVRVCGLRVIVTYTAT